jgi:hypothetical protein
MNMRVLKISTNSIDKRTFRSTNIYAHEFSRDGRRQRPGPIFISAFCGPLKLRIFSAYDPTSFGRKNRCRFWRGEQAQYRLGDREGLGRSRRTLDF